MDKSFKLKVKTDEKSLTQTSGKFTIEPLDRGYGITLGNAMRRVLLTSIPGAAVTHVKIEGVDHEFSSKGVAKACNCRGDNAANALSGICDADQCWPKSVYVVGRPIYRNARFCG